MSTLDLAVSTKLLWLDGRLVDPPDFTPQKYGGKSGVEKEREWEDEKKNTVVPKKINSYQAEPC